MTQEGRNNRGRVIGLSAAAVAGVAAATAAGLFGYRAMKTRRHGHEHAEIEHEKITLEEPI